MFAMNRWKSFLKIVSYQYWKVRDANQGTDQSWKTIQFKLGLKKKKNIHFRITGSACLPCTSKAFAEPEGKWAQARGLPLFPPASQSTFSVSLRPAATSVPYEFGSYTRALADSVKRKTNPEKELNVFKSRTSQGRPMTVTRSKNESRSEDEVRTGGTKTLDWKQLAAKRQASLDLRTWESSGNFLSLILCRLIQHSTHLHELNSTELMEKHTPSNNVIAMLARAQKKKKNGNNLVVWGFSWYNSFPCQILLFFGYVYCFQLWKNISHYRAIFHQDHLTTI